MTDINELAQRMKAAALKAIADEGPTWFSKDQLSHPEGIALHEADVEFIALASHENVLALVEALEAKGKQIDILRQDKDTVIDTSLERINKILSRAEAAEKRIAELTEKPIGWTDEQELRDVEKLGCGYLFNANPITPHADPRRVILLYAAAAGKGEAS